MRGSLWFLVATIVVAVTWATAVRLFHDAALPVRDELAVQSEAASPLEHFTGQIEDASRATLDLAEADSKAARDEHNVSSPDRETDIAEGSFGAGLESRIVWELSRLEVAFVGLEVSCRFGTCQVQLEYASQNDDGSGTDSIARKLRNFATALADPEIGVEHVRMRHDSPAYDTSFVRTTIVLSRGGPSMLQFYEDLALRGDPSVD